MPDETEQSITLVPSESALEIKIHAEVTKTLVEEPKAPSEDKDIVVVASNPKQMQVAQTNLIEWVETKYKHLSERKKEANENLQIATKNKWSTKTLKKIVGDLNKDMEYYEKIETALRNGYVIIPNFDEIDIFAVRTTRAKPKDTAVTMRRYDNSTRPVLPAEETNSPSVGEGQYVDADPKHKFLEWNKLEGDNKSVPMITAKPDGFKDIMFPFLMAKPQIFEKTAEAMKVLCFDDIGVLPGRHKSRKRGDPMIIGRIRRKTSQYSFHTVSFLITWFIDTKDL